MRSTMQDDFNLDVPSIVRHAQALHGPVEVASFDGTTVSRTTYAAVLERVRRLAGALRAAGVKPGDRVGTFMWNTRAHLEAYFAVPGMGAVLNTINIRLFPDQVAWIVGEAQDEVLLVDTSLWETLAPVLTDTPRVRLVVIAGDLDLEMAQALTSVPVVGYEDFLDGAEPVELEASDERAPALMCYTSGTTGAPKGVVYSHRSVWLHAMANLTSAGFGIGEADRLLQVVPMFHANGWGFPYAALLGGASLVLPDRFLQPELLAPLIAAERPTVSGGVPTVWRGVHDHAQEHGIDLTSLRLISCAGSAVPEQLLRDYQSLGIDLLQAWGMTETSPLAAIARPPAVRRERDEWYWRTRTGRPLPGVEVRAVDEEGIVLPHDGIAVGELEVRGPWVTGAYHGGAGASKFHDGWLRTGDVGTIDEAGAMKITDRSKDVIKSGGEWISSTELEDHLMSHPAVLEAAVIGVPDPRWEERPLAIVHLRPGQEDLADEELRAHLLQHVAKWQVPEHWVRVSALPKTGVGKLDKQALRHEYPVAPAGQADTRTLTPGH